MSSDALDNELELSLMSNSLLLARFVKAYRRLEEIQKQTVQAKMAYARVAVVLSRRILDVSEEGQMVVYDGFTIEVNHDDSSQPIVNRYITLE